MENFTQLEKTVLRTFLADQNVYDFGEGVYTDLETFQYSIKDRQKIEISIDTLKGVVGSLIKKNIIELEDCGEGAFFWLAIRFSDKEEMLEEYLEAVK